jgi:hypothetical protein
MVFRPIQIKYSVTNATVPTLIPGELAFTQAGNNFFIGSPDGSSGNIRIGHKLHDGVLTANEALVANSTGGIDRIIVGDGSFYSLNTQSIISRTITTDNIVTGNINVSQISTSNVSITKLLANSSTGEVGYVLTSGGASGNIYWKQITEANTSNIPYFVTSQMYDFRGYNMGFMNIAPNQNAETLGFRKDVTIPYGAIWLLAKNTTDEPPVTIYSPGTIVTPMMWISIDKSGPYSDDNPNGQDYWFNITPPPSGA